MLYLVLKIANNHCRTTNFDSKIEQILVYLLSSTNHSLSNLEKYDFFKSNKPILLFLFQNEIIKIDDKIAQLILIRPTYYEFFYPEIKEFLNENEKNIIEEKLLHIDSDFLTNFDQKCQIGENDSYICNLIRNNSIESFIQYMNKENLSYSSQIRTSIFETNTFLIDKTPTLIEYAAFFGSIDILQYLHANNAELTKSIWIYAVHSNNPEVINFLIENNINKNDNSVYEDALIEAVKCHHNDVVEFIENNLITQEVDLKEGQSEFNEKFFESVFQSYNYRYFPDNLKINNSFYYLNRYYYNKIVTLYFNSIKEELEAQMKGIQSIFKFKSSFYSFFYKILNYIIFMIDY